MKFIPLMENNTRPISSQMWPVSSSCKTMRGRRLTSNHIKLETFTRNNWQSLLLCSLDNLLMKSNYTQWLFTENKIWWEASKQKRRSESEWKVKHSENEAACSCYRQDWFMPVWDRIELHSENPHVAGPRLHPAAQLFPAVSKWRNCVWSAVPFCVEHAWYVWHIFHALYKICVCQLCGSEF